MWLPVVSLLLLAVSSRVLAQDTADQTAFTDAKIVPDVISDFAPAFPLQVIFTDASGNKINVTQGMQLTINQTANRPDFALVSSNTAITGKPYLIAMVDPDAPTPQNTSSSQIRHFLGPNFVSPGPSGGVFPLANQSAALSNYLGPLPPNGSDAHRYVILCYLQSTADITPPASFNATSVTNFNISTFASDVGGLTLLAGLYFKVAPDATNGSSSASSTASGSSSGASAGATGTAPNAASQLATVSALPLALAAFAALFVM